MRRSTVLIALCVLAIAARTPADAVTSADPPLAPEPSVRELRLGVVCYGGVSLAIYMFGTVRELHHLLLASDALELDAHAGGHRPPRDLGPQGQALPASARPYYRLLASKWEREGVRTRVVVDIIAGTSAGGINGIILGKAIATNRSVDELRRLWLEEAEIGRLAAWRPWWLSAPWRLVRKKPALEGDRWLRQLYGAFEWMDRQPGGSASPDLLPPGTKLELLVTGTDYYGSPRVIEIGDPAISEDRYHNHVFRFGHSGGASSRARFEGLQGNAALAFAARASASFPVVFPPVSVGNVVEALDVPELDQEKLVEALFPHQLSAGSGEPAALAATLFLIDGGVLDNKPLGIAFERVQRTVPTVPSRRVFLYLEPDPAVPIAAGESGSAPGAPNSWQMFWAAQTTIPGAEPIGGDLELLMRHNRRVERILDIVASDEQVARRSAPMLLAAPGAEAETPVAVRVESYATPIGRDQRGAPLLREVKALREQLEAEAASGSRLVEEGYLRLRVHSVLEQLAHVLATQVCQLPEDFSGRRVTLAREVVAAWAHSRGLTGPEVDRELRATFLESWDVGYLRRNLRFVLQWIEDRYPGAAPAAEEQRLGGPEVPQLEEAHRAVTAAIAELTHLAGGQELDRMADPVLFGGVQSTFCEVEIGADRVREQAVRLVEEHGDRLDELVDSVGPALLEAQECVRHFLYLEFARQTATWYPADRREVLGRYLGFPFWDRLAYPYTAFSGTGELTRAEIVRLSPRDVEELGDAGAAKLAGSRIGHFGAFFGRPGRESDYLWGRLDGAERLAGLLDRDAAVGALFTAILDEEAAVGGRDGVSKEVLARFRNCLAHRESPDCSEPPSR